MRQEMEDKDTLYVTTNYIYMYMVENSMVSDVVAVHAGYVGSSKDYYYLSRGTTEDASRLGHRNRKYKCKPCLDLTFEDCLLTRVRTNLCAGTTPQSTWVNFILLGHPQKLVLLEMQGILYLTFVKD